MWPKPWFDSWVGKIPWRRDRLPTPVFLSFPCGSAGKESVCNAGDLGLIPRLRRSPGEGKGYPLQYSGLENSMDSIYSLWGCKEYVYVSATAAAKLLQSWPTLCDPIDHSPPGSPVPGILQARTLEWVAISFSNAWKWKVKVKSLSRVRLEWPRGLQPTRLLRPWEFPGKNTGVGCHCLLWYMCLHTYNFLV